MIQKSIEPTERQRSDLSPSSDVDQTSDGTFAPKAKPQPKNVHSADPEISAADSKRAWLRRITSSVGPSLVLLGFAGVFYFGHTNDWTVPKFATLVGTAEPVTDDWCADHAVPASICVECNPDLMPPKQDFGWCNEHGVHNCVLDHPELAELKQSPSSGQLKADQQRAESALAIRPRKQNNSRCTLYERRIQFASIESVQQAGVDIGLVERDRIVESVAGNGEIVYAPTRKADLSARVPGSVWSVEKNIGDQVREGDVLALVDATAVGTLKSELIAALAEENLQRKNVARLQEARQAVAGSRIIEADAALAKARADVLNAEQAIRNLGLPLDADRLRGLSEQQAMDRLRLLGIPKSARPSLDTSAVTANLLPVLAPMDGTVIDRSVSLGEVVDPSRTLFEIVDTSQMWLKLSLPLEAVDPLQIGQRIRFTPDGSGRVVQGQLDWISTGADRNTRMIDVRAVLENRDGRLRDKTFGTGEVSLRSADDAIVVPSEAIHWEGCCHIVFVRDQDYFAGADSPKVFHVRSVRLGARDNGRTEIISGVLPGEIIAVSGSDVLRAQLLKNGLGAGCCVEE